MKILIIRNFPSYMAVKNNTYNIQEVGLAKALIRKGNTCDILFWTDKQEETVEIPVFNGGVLHVFYRHGKSQSKERHDAGAQSLVISERTRRNLQCVDPSPPARRLLPLP